VADLKRPSLTREVVTAVIGVGIFVVTSYMLVRTFSFGAQSFGDEGSPGARALMAAFGRQKDMLLYALSLLGTVTGYYLGRVPAERAADRASEQAQDAKRKTAAVASAARAVVKTSRDMLQPERSTLSLRGRSSDADSSASIEFHAAVDALEQELLH
jgi:hypothetical protein